MLRKVVARVGLEYLCRFPIQRGKVRAARLLDRLTRGTPLTSPLGPLVSARLGDTTFWQIMREYQPFIGASLEGLVAGDVFIDVGANMGMFSLVAAQRVGPTGRVFAFEPSLREFHELVRNLHLNRASNVTPFRLALDDADVTAEFCLADELQSGMNCRTTSDGGSGQTEPILAMRFDALGLARVIDPTSRVFIKIDAEGCEQRVLRGMQHFLSTHNVVRIVAELNDVLLERLGGSRREVHEFLQRADFVRLPDGAGTEFDEVFERRELAASTPKLAALS